jgi:hypothetical protein
LSELAGIDRQDEAIRRIGRLLRERLLEREVEADRTCALRAHDREAEVEADDLSIELRKDGAQPHTDRALGLNRPRVKGIRDVEEEGAAEL